MRFRVARPQLPRIGAVGVTGVHRRAYRKAGDEAPADYLPLYLHNRDILLTPFHNMALMCPATTAADVDRHTEVFGAAVAELVGEGG